MKKIINLFAVTIVLMAFTNCKNNEVKLSEYKYADKTLDISCDQINKDLLKEAVLSFEDDISSYYGRSGNKNLSQAYSRTVNLATYGRARYQDIVSDHSKEVFNVLKSQKNLWTVTEEKTTLNYEHPLVKCIGENLTDKDFKTTYNALLSTNSMRPELLADAIRRQSSLALKDKYLATYLALDLYYAKLFNVDFSATKQKNQVGQQNTIQAQPKAKAKTEKK